MLHSTSALKQSRCPARPHIVISRHVADRPAIARYTVDHFVLILNCLQHHRPHPNLPVHSPARRPRSVTARTLPFTPYLLLSCSP